MSTPHTSDALHSAAIGLVAAAFNPWDMATKLVFAILVAALAPRAGRAFDWLAECIARRWRK